MLNMKDDSFELDFTCDRVTIDPRMNKTEIHYSKIKSSIYMLVSAVFTGLGLLILGLGFGLFWAEETSLGVILVGIFIVIVCVIAAWFSAAKFLDNSVVITIDDQGIRDLSNKREELITWDNIESVVYDYQKSKTLGRRKMGVCIKLKNKLENETSADPNVVEAVLSDIAELNIPYRIHTTMLDVSPRQLIELIEAGRQTYERSTL